MISMGQRLAILLKRNSTAGVLLGNTPILFVEHMRMATSGYLRNTDILLLQKKFLRAANGPFLETSRAMPLGSLGLGQQCS